MPQNGSNIGSKVENLAFLLHTRAIYGSGQELQLTSRTVLKRVIKHRHGPGTFVSADFMRIINVSQNQSV